VFAGTCPTKVSLVDGLVTVKLPARLTGPLAIIAAVWSRNIPGCGVEKMKVCGLGECAGGSAPQLFGGLGAKLPLAMCAWLNVNWGVVVVFVVAGAAVVDVAEAVVVVAGAIVVVVLSDLDLVAVRPDSDVAVTATGSAVAKPVVLVVDELAVLVATFADWAPSFPTSTIVRMISVINAPQTVTNAMRRAVTFRRRSGHADSSSSH
jgi:hypothetical protein